MLLGAWELLVVAVAALLLLGPEKLPDLMRTLARLVGQAQKLVSDAKQSVSDALNEEPPPQGGREDRSVYSQDDDKAAFSDWAHAQAKASSESAAKEKLGRDDVSPQPAHNDKSQPASEQASQSEDKKEGA